MTLRVYEGALASAGDVLFGGGPPPTGNVDSSSNIRNRPGERTQLAHSWHNGGSPVKPNWTGV